MIKNYLFTILCLFSFFLSYAQFKFINNKTGEELENGYEFHTTGFGWPEPDGDESWRFKYRIVNTSEKDIYTRIIVHELVNYNDTYVECYYSNLENSLLKVGFSFPFEGRTELIKPNNIYTGTGGFTNIDESGCEMVKWTLKIQQYEDEEGTIEIGKPFYFSYVYNGHLNVLDVELKNIKVYASLDKNIFKVETSEQLALSVYNLSGKLVKEYTISDNQLLDLSQLSAQPYILNFSNSKGQRYIKKITVK